MSRKGQPCCLIVGRMTGLFSARARGLARAACLAAFLSLASCVTPGDLERRDEAFARYQEQAEERLDELRAGTIPEEEYRLGQKESAIDLQSELKGIVDDVKDRTESAVAAVKTGATITGLGPIGDLLATAILGGAGAFVGVNRHRDKRRVDRKEPV